MESCCWNVGLMNLVGGGCKVGLIEVVGGGGCEMENFDGVGGGGSNVGTSEVVGGGGIEVVGEGRGVMINFRRVGGGDGVNLDIFGFRRFTLSEIIFELGEESLVLLSSNNLLNSSILIWNLFSDIDIKSTSMKIPRWSDGDT